MDPDSGVVFQSLDYLFSLLSARKCNSKSGVSKKNISRHDNKIMSPSDKYDNQNNNRNDYNNNQNNRNNNQNTSQWFDDDGNYNHTNSNNDNNNNNNNDNSFTNSNHHNNHNNNHDNHLDNNDNDNDNNDDEFDVEISMLEIFNEKVKDLLADKDSDSGINLKSGSIDSPNSPKNKNKIKILNKYGNENDNEYNNKNKNGSGNKNENSANSSPKKSKHVEISVRTVQEAKELILRYSGKSVSTELYDHGNYDENLDENLYDFRVENNMNKIYHGINGYQGKTSPLRTPNSSNSATKNFSTIKKNISNENLTNGTYDTDVRTPHPKSSSVQSHFIIKIKVRPSW